MKVRIATILSVSAALAMVASAQQTYPRRATIMGGARPDGGKCTVEVVVDGIAEVEVRGDTATLRNLSGQPPQWRRFECTSAMPTNPGEFRFSGVDGRGRQQLMRDPRQGGVAVVRIEDSQGGAEGYTFDLEWGSRGGSFGPQGGGPPVVIDRSDRDHFGGGGGHRFTTEQAIQTCKDAVRQQSADRFRSWNVEFRRTQIDDNPGRNDWVIGTFVARRGGREDVFRFSCSVDFNTGRVRSAQIDPMNNGGGRFGGFRDERTQRAAVQNCEQSARERLRRDGYGRIEVSNIRVDDNPGRNDWVIGNARGEGRYGTDSFEFSCSVNLDSGVVRNVDVRRR